MANKKTPVTSVTPKSTVKPVSKAQQARTRKLIAGIASVTPVGRAAKAATTAAKTTKVVKTLAEPKSAVRVKPAARTKPNKPDAAKTNYKNMDTYERARKAEIKAGNDPETAHEVALGMKYFYGKRKPNLEIKTSSGKPDVRKPARVPDKRATKTKVINSGKNFTATRISIYRAKPVIKKKSK